MKQAIVVEGKSRSDADVNACSVTIVKGNYRRIKGVNPFENDKLVFLSFENFIGEMPLISRKVEFRQSDGNSL